MDKRVKTYTAEIQMGLREGYSDIVHKISEVEKICQKYCDLVGLCVTVTKTSYIYTRGNEPGCKIGLISYSRFAVPRYIILRHAYNLATILIKELKQFRCSIVCTDYTYLIENKELSTD